MEPLHIPKDEFTPFVSFNPFNNTYEISGVSRPEDVKGFYSQILNWIEKLDSYYLLNLPGKIRIIFKMAYCNSASAKQILQILERFKNYQSQGSVLEIEWHYEETDEQMLEDGEDLSDALDIKFTYHTY